MQGRRLLSLPSQAVRRRAVLEHLAAVTFVDGEELDEPGVDARLQPWCEDGAVDHVALRRYLVEDGLLSRGGGVYRAGPGAVPGPAERYVEAMGLR